MRLAGIASAVISLHLAAEETIKLRAVAQESCEPAYL